jgi:asparagine synthase (glutamine-hydrolysing)
VEGKRLLRKVVAPYLPDDIVNRPKQGFVAPLNDWLNNNFLSVFDNLCLGSGAYLAGLLDQKAVLKMRRNISGEIPNQDIYALLILELWLRRINNKF